MADTPQFDPSQPFQDASGSVKTPQFDPSQPFQDSGAAPQFDPSQPFQESAPSREDLIAQKKQELLDENKQSGLQFAGDIASNVLNPLKSVPAIGSLAKSFIYDPAKAAVQDVGDIVTGQPNAVSNLGKDVSTGAALGFLNTKQGVQKIPQFFGVRGSGTLSDEQAQKFAENEIARQEEHQNLASVAGTPERAEAFSQLEDPTNVALMGEGVASNLAKRFGVDASKAALEGGKLAASGEIAARSEKGIEGLTDKNPVSRSARVANVILNGIGKATGGVSDITGGVQNWVSEKAASFLPKELAESGIGKTMSLGALGHMAGLSVPASAVVATLPETFKTISSLSKAASRVIMDGEGSTPFFKALSEDPLVQGRAKAIATLMDKTGMGRVIEGLGRTLGVPLDHPGVPAAFAIYGTLASGGNADEASQAILGAYGIPMLGHAVGEPFHDNARATIAAKQIGDTLHYFSNISDVEQRAWLQRMDDHPEGRQAAADELIAVSQMSKLRPGAGIEFVQGDETPHFDPTTGKVVLSLSGGDALPHLLAHEMWHEYSAQQPEGSETPRRTAILTELVGNPELKQGGFLVDYAPDGSWSAKPEFKKFADGYLNALAQDLSSRKNPDGTVKYSLPEVTDMVNQRNNPRILAEEWLAEQVGLLWSSTTRHGELGLARIARQGGLGKLFSDTVLNNTSNGIVASAARLFGISEDQIRNPKWGDRDSGLPKSLRTLLTNAVHEGLIHDPAEQRVYSREFSDVSLKPSDFKKNPKQTAEYLGASNNVKWSFDPTTGDPRFEGFVPDRAANKLTKEQGKVLFDLLATRKPSSPDEVQWRDQTDVNGKTTRVLTGKFLPPDIVEAIKSSGKFNPFQIRNLEQLQASIKNNEAIRFFYQTASKNRKLVALEGGWRTSLPYEIKISTPDEGKSGPNILFNVLDMKRFEDNYRNAIKRNRKSTNPVEIPEFNEARQQLLGVLKNLEIGYKGDGTLEPGKPQPSEKPAILLPEAKKNFINELLGIDMASNRGRNMLREMVKGEGLKSSDSAIISLRLDRINKIASDPNIGNVKVRYDLAKQNYSPAEKKEDINGWMDTSGAITPKGNKLHNEIAVEKTGIQDPIAAANSFFEKGHMRVRVDLGRMFLSNESGKTPTPKQLKEAKDLAIEHGLRSVVYDGPSGNKVLWSASQDAGMSYSPSEKRVPNEDTRKAAEEYMKGRGMPYTPYSDYKPVDKEYAKKVADVFESMKHNPSDPEVQKAYKALSDETKAQWDYMTGPAGIKVEMWDKKGQPYANSTEMREDVEKNKHMYVFPTEQGYGNSEKSDVEHPMLTKSGVILDGKELLVNDLFRAVHDYFGHTKEGYEFGPRGEYNAYLAHKPMFSEAATPALAAETLAQNSWVNFGKHLRNEQGNIPTKGEEGYLPVTERPYAEQKAVAMPRELWSPSEKLKTEKDTQLVPVNPPEHGMAGKRLRLIHFSTKSDLSTIDPKKAGTGVDRGRNDPGMKKSFFFVSGSGMGQDARLVGGNKYSVTISPKGIYDLSGDDPLGFWSNPNREMQEEMLKKQGYTGVRVNSGGRDVVALFHPVKTAVSESGKLYSPTEGLKVRGDVKDAIEKYLMPQETLTNNNIDAFKEAWKHVSEKEEDLEAAARAGEAKRGWYKKSADSIKALFGADAPTFAKVLAATSPQQSVKENLKMALSFWNKWNEEGRSTDESKLMEIMGADPVKKTAGMLDLWARVPNTIRAIKGESTLSGFKVDSFYRNLLNDLEPVTNDTWNSKFFDIDPDKLGTKSSYYAMTGVVRKVARKLGWKPAEVQETMWSFFSHLFNSQSMEKSGQDVMKEITPNDLLSVQDFDKLIYEDKSIRNLVEQLGLRLPTKDSVSTQPSIPETTTSETVYGRASPGDKASLERIADHAQTLFFKGLDAEQRKRARANRETISEPF